MNRKDLEIKNYSDIWLIAEDDFDSEMNEVVEPLLIQTIESGYLMTDDKKELYYEMYKNPDAIGNIVISHGFTENSEKFREIIYYFYSAGYSVFIYDHRGHGRSYRAVTNWSITHVDKFEEYVQDMKLVVDNLVKPNSGSVPIYAYAHSMGGAITASYAQQYPKDYKKLILSSPMLSINFGDTPAYLGRIMSGAAVLFGKGKEKMYIHQEFNPDEKFEDSSATSRARYDRYFKKRLSQKEFRNYAGSYAWLKQAIKGTKRIFSNKNIRNLKMPILLFQAENDNVVTPDGQNKLAEKVESLQLVYVKKVKHEIYLSENEILNAYLHEILEFLKK